MKIIYTWTYVGSHQGMLLTDMLLGLHEELCGCQNGSKPVIYRTSGVWACVAQKHKLAQNGTLLHGQVD